ncbi:hypothetical protein ACX80V_21425 [Arthrobacter sp. MDT3-24]
MNEQPGPNTPDPDSGSDNPQASDPKPRPVYDTTVSESTRELRDTSRRRRDAEEKLQQHLLEAKEHVPHHYDHEPHKHGQEPPTAEGKGSAGPQENTPEETKPQQKNPGGDAS